MQHNFGLIGRNISYSFSRSYFARKFEDLDLRDHAYRNFDLEEIGQFPEVIETTPGLIGLNVTIPYKESVIPFMDELDPVAKAIGAVNTISIKNGKLTGHNTDAYGFETSLRPFIPENGIEKALVLGTGGASKAVMYTLEKLGIAAVRVSRKRARGLLTYEDLNAAVLREHQLVVNCTPLGTFPNINDKPDLPYEQLNTTHLLYDLIYNPEETAFLKEGKKRGAQTCNGYQMLVHQAEKAWEIWNS